MLKGELVTNPSFSVHRFGSNGYSSYELIQSPVANCQIFGVRRTEIMIQSASPELVRERFTNLYYTLDQSRPLALIDIKSNLVPRITNAYPPDKILVNAPYNSSNGSQMTIMLINVKP